MLPALRKVSARVERFDENGDFDRPLRLTADGLRRTLRTMLKRGLVGLVKGLLVGGALAAGLVYGLGVPVFAAWLAYLMAIVTGALTGLVAGRPIWAKDARIEAGLKAAAGAVVAALAMFGIRQWLGVSFDLGDLGKGMLGDLPLTSLPLIATLLALFFEIDNTGEEPKGEAASKQRVASGEKARLEDALDDLVDEDASASSEKLRHKN